MYRAALVCFAKMKPPQASRKVLAILKDKDARCATSIRSVRMPISTTTIAMATAKERAAATSKVRPVE